MAALVLFSLVPLLRAQTPAIPERTRAANDASEYRRLVLDNGIKVILLSDPKLNQSSAALVVEVGALSDPSKRQGLAHFLEHMLFLGTEKFPNEAEYGNYLRSNGGYSNAYTAGDHTNYHFEIRHEAFEGAIDRFSQFFIAPLFTPQFTEREINAVNSENQKNLENDDWRAYQLANSLYREGHPANHFSTGNRDTLAGTTREELLKFYTGNYSANRMALALTGKAPLDQLEAWARQYFSVVKNHDLPPARYPADYLPPKPALRLATMEPIKDVRELVLEFPLPGLREQWAAKPAELVEFILSYEGEGGLLAQLKAEDLATKIYTELDRATGDYHALRIGFELTEVGLEKRDRVLALVFAMIAEMRRAGFPTALFKERAALARISEMFEDQGEGAARARALANQARTFPLEVAERAPFLWLHEDPAAYARVLDQLRPDNLLVLVAAKGVPTDQTEHYYGTKFAYHEDAGAAYAALLQPPAVAGLHLPRPNPFIPDRTSQLALQPVRLIDEPALSLYYAQDAEFQRPMVAELFRVRLPREMGTRPNSVRLKFYEACVNEALNETAFTAEAAGLHFALAADLEGVVLRVDGYDAGAPRLFDAVVAQLVEISLSEERFAAVKDRLVRGLANFPHADAWQILLATRRSVVREFYFRPDEELAVAQKISLTDVRAFARTLYAKGRIEGLVYGNVPAADAIAAARRLSATMRIKPVPPEQLLRRRVLTQPVGDRVLTTEHFGVNNSAFRREYQLGDDSPEIRAATKVLASFIEEPFYGELRTRQQVGYIVSGGAGDELRTHFAFFLIQSGDYPADQIATRADTFIAELPRLLDETPEEAWQMIIAGVRAELEQKDKTVAARAARLFELAYDFDAEWDRREATLAALDRLTKPRTREILAAALAPSSIRSRTFLGFARDHQPGEAIKPTFTDRAAWKKSRSYR